MSNNNKLMMYRILNDIKPPFKRTKYPYSYWTPDKIVYTQKKIKLEFSKDEEFFKRPSKNKKKRGGGKLNSNKFIWIFL